MTGWRGGAVSAHMSQLFRIIGEGKIKVVGQVGQLRRYRVRLTKRENAAIKKLARRHDALPPKTLGVAYDIEMLKKVLEDVEIYVDEIYRQSPKKPIEEAVEVAVHEICHKEGLNEEQATIATDILLKDKKLKHSLAEKTKRALKESKILGAVDDLAVLGNM